MVCGFIVRLASCEKVLIELNCDILHSSEVALLTTARSKSLMLEFCTGTMGTKLYVSLITKDLQLEIYFLSKHLPCF